MTINLLQVTLDFEVKQDLLHNRCHSDQRRNLESGSLLSKKISRQWLHALLYLLYPYSRPAGRNDSSLKTLKQLGMSYSKVSIQFGIQSSLMKATCGFEP